MKLLLFPLQLELKSFVNALNVMGQKSSKTLVNRLPVFEFKDLNIRCVLGGHGKVQFAIHTQFFLNHFKDCGAVLCLGTSGSLDEQVRPMDVVVATETVEHDFNLKFVTRDKPKFLADERLVEKFKRFKPRDFNLHFGTVASGDEDVLDSKRAAAIKQESGALAVAWEGAGGARVCRFLNIPFIEVRAISDIADEAASLDFRGSIVQSMTNLAFLIVELAKK